MCSIKKVIIKTFYGYCCIEEAYNDVLTITQDSISYKYIPFIEDEVKTWSYKSNHPAFKEAFNRISENIEKFVSNETVEECTDVGGVEFYIHYTDKTKNKVLFFAPISRFKKIFNLIKPLVPPLENIMY